MGKKKIEGRSKIKPFVKVVGYNHLLPTRYTLDVALDKTAVNKEAVKGMFVSVCSHLCAYSSLSESIS